MCDIPIKILTIVASCVLLWFGIRGYSEGRVKEEGDERIDREKSPFNYWITVFIYIGGGIAGIVFAFFSP